MYFYKTFNLNIRSEIPLPELTIGGNGSDVSILLKKIKSSTYNEERDFSSFFKVRLADNCAYLLLETIDICKICCGKEIIINPESGLDPLHIRLIILGPALTILLHQNRNLILHASAVNINGGAVAFLGDNGLGKSTTLFTLHKKGYSLITDDILAVTYDKSLPLVNPSYPRLKLRQDIMEYMEEDLDSTPKTHKDSQKFSYYVNKFYNNQLMLKKIYIIEKGDTFRLSTMNRADSLMKIIKSSYCYEIFTKKEIGSNLIDCSKIVAKVPVKTLKIPHSFNEIPKLIEIIENDN